MHIREATQNDIPAILEVLRASLGEISSKKTEAIWRYKHLENPFGESLVLIAEEEEEEGQVVGVRAFMHWQWQKGRKVFSAFRAVDTATHPAHQGKGIFKSLTLKALEIGHQRGDNFVFNTPNSKSKPGYLKMGWKEVGQLKVQIRLLNLLKLRKEDFNFKVTGKPETGEDLLKKYNHQAIQTNLLFVHKNSNFLKWRYFNNPVQQYSIVSTKSMFIAGYPKFRNKFIEFRISEAIIAPQDLEAGKAAILQMANKSGAHFLSISPNSNIKFKSSVNVNFGPVFTFKSINCEEKNFLKLNNWDYSLGDLELY